MTREITPYLDTFRAVGISESSFSVDLSNIKNTLSKYLQKTGIYFFAFFFRLKIRLSVLVTCKLELGIFLIISDVTLTSSPHFPPLRCSIKVVVQQNDVDEIKFTAQKMKFSINDFFSYCDQIRSFQRIWPHLLKKSLMENFIFCEVVFLHQWSKAGKCYMQIYFANLLIYIHSITGIFQRT